MRFAQPNLARVNAAAHRADQTRFNALLHHVDWAALERAFRQQKRQMSAGIDGITVEMYAALKERMAKFGLALHEEKTRLIEFGRLPALARRQRGLRRPETFAFLGSTYYCGWTRDGRFIVKLKTQSKRLTRKLKALRQ